MSRRLTNEEIEELIAGYAIYGVLQKKDYIHFARALEDKILDDYRVGQYAMESNDTISIRGNTGLGGKALK